MMTDDQIQQAKCLTVDPELFFPSQQRSRDTSPAVRACYECPVREPCLTDALNRRERHGTWGGLTAPQREEVLSRTARTRAGAS